MDLIQVPQISFQTKICGVKWRHFYNNIAKKDIVTDMELIFGQLIAHDKNEANVVFVAMLIL